MGGHILGHYINGNHSTILLADGTKIKETGHWVDIGEGHKKWEADDQDHFTYDFPENFDLKITDYCDGGCAYCHENSTVKGKHGDLSKLDHIIDTIHAGTEIACLTGDTIVHTPNGSKEIKQLRVGDAIYNSNNTISFVKRISTKIKPVYRLKFKHGFTVNASLDHPFMVNGTEVAMEHMVGNQVDLIPVCKGNREIPVTDMAKYIHHANPSKHVSSRGGSIIGDNEIRLTVSGHHSVRYVKFDISMAYLYGWFVAEGSRSSLTMCNNEVADANRLLKIWKKSTRLGGSIQVHDELHSLNLELHDREFVKHLMFDEYAVGNGAKNKNLGFLYTVTNKRLIRSALLGLFKGDGCFRSRVHKNKYITRSISLKTSSKRLAYDVVYLLRKWFGINASINYGITTSKRPIGNRELPPSEYYQIEILNAMDQHKLFPTLFDGNTNKTSNTIRPIKAVSLVNTNEDSMLYDITLDGNVHTFPVNGMIITHNCGGGNALAHPGLVEFLTKLKERRIVANMTVNQRHINAYYSLLKQLVDDKLVHGIGVSLVDSKDADSIEKAVSLGNNVVFHVIAGIFSEEDWGNVDWKGKKMLVLGYKDLRRGHSLFVKDRVGIYKNINWMADNLKEMSKVCKCLSFDCLGIDQLDVQRTLGMSDEEYYTRFQGSDTDVHDAEGNITCATMYVDLPNMKVARMSTAALDKRFDFTGNESISELLRTTTQGW